MKTLDRKLLRELARSWGLLLAIVSIIAVGVTCFVGMRSVYFNLSLEKQRYYAQCRMADFWIDVKKVPLAELEAIVALPGIREIRPRIQFSATVDLEGATSPINGLVLSLPNERRQVVNDIVLRQGDYFTPRRRNEVLVNDAFARKHKLFPGGTLHLLLNNRREELFIVGTAISSEFTYLVGPGSFVPDSEHFGVFYLKEEFAEDVFDLRGAANQIVGRFTPNIVGSGEETLRRAEVLLEAYGVSQTTLLRQQASHQFLSGEIDQLGTFAMVFPTVFLIVAVLILNVLMLRMTRQQRTVIGTLKALGYTDQQIFLHYLKFGVFVGLAGGVLGGIGGYGDATLATSLYRGLFEFPKLESRIYPGAYAIGILLSLVCSWFGSWFGARSALRLPPAQAMRPEPPKHGRQIWLEKVTWLWRHMNATTRMILRNLIRARLRTSMGVFSAAMGASLLVNGFMLVEATAFMLDFQFHKISRSDIDLTFKDEHGVDALDEVRRLPGVDLAEPTFSVACTFSHGSFRRKGAITGVSPDARLTIPRDQLGEPLRLPTTGVVLTTPLAERLHVQKGDRLTVLPARGQRRTLTLDVVGVSDTYIGMAAFADIHYLCRLMDEDFAVNGAQLQIDNVAANLPTLYRELKQLPGLQAVNSRRDMVRNLTETLLTNQRIFISILVFFASTVFLGSIVNSSLISLAERQNEVATFRAIGFTPWQIGGMYLRESLLTTLTGTLLGLPGGYFLTWFMTVSYTNDMLRIPLVTAPWIWQVALAMAVLFTLLAHSVAQWSILRLNFVEALKVKE